MPEPQTSEPHLRALIADDEPFGRERLTDLIAAAPGVDLVGVAEDGDGAVDAIRRLVPDIVFLDVQMPGRSGLDVVAAVGPEAMPVTVFVTAYDRHALEAFRLAALDYLLKPFDDDRFAEALARARETVRLRRLDQTQAHSQTEPGGEAALPEAPAAPAYVERLTVEMRGQVRVVPVGRITHVTAAGAYAEVYTATEQFVLRQPMHVLDARLDPAHFIRVHRSAIVRIECVEALLTAPGGDYTVRLQGGARVKVARGRRDALAARLGGARPS